MKTEQSLYIRILLWAYEKQVVGFTEQELKDQFGITGNSDLTRWYINMFRNGTNDNPPMFIHFITKSEVGYFCLSDKGMSAAIDYLDLKEARENSKSAMRMAIGSLVLATIVGVAQIIVQLWCK